ncbi:MAG: hypothetical protein E7590_05935 [Ruminococcaceae bacterium]|nr:hypothetical protein [Oscillospiraceae bacterium]
MEFAVVLLALALFVLLVWVVAKLSARKSSSEFTREFTKQPHTTQLPQKQSENVKQKKEDEIPVDVAEEAEEKEDEIFVDNIEEAEKEFEEYPLVGLRVIKIPILYTGDFSVGNIVAQNGKYLTILFGVKEGKWEYPALFLKEYIRFGDPELQKAFESGNLTFTDNSVKLPKPLNDFSVVQPRENTDNAPAVEPAVPAPASNIPESPTSQLTLDEALRKIAQAQPPFWVTHSSAGDMVGTRKLTKGLHYGRKGQDIYLQGCRVFDWNRSLKSKFAMMQIMYAYHGARDKKSVWMLPNHAGVKPIKAKATAQWWNTFADELVFEEWKEPTSDFYYDFSKRITFAKTKSNGYAFIGVYNPEQLLKGLDCDGVMHYIKVYRRIQREYVG